MKSDVVFHYKMLSIDGIPPLHVHARTHTIIITILCYQQVWEASTPHIADYIRIRVEHGLSPTKAALLLGMVQGFTTSVVSEGRADNVVFRIRSSFCFLSQETKHFFFQRPMVIVLE